MGNACCQENIGNGTQQPVLFNQQPTIGIIEQCDAEHGDRGVEEAEIASTATANTDVGTDIVREHVASLHGSQAEAGSIGTRSAFDVIHAMGACLQADITCDFRITLQKIESCEMLGAKIVVSKDNSQFVILKPSGRAFETWNETNPTKAIRPGDEIIEVNQITGHATLLLEMIKNEMELELTLRRQVKFALQLVKSGPIGLRLNVETHRVSAILAGMIYTWNWVSPANGAIFVGDLLVGVTVNGKMALQYLVEALEEANEGDLLKLCFERPAVS